MWRQPALWKHFTVFCQVSGFYYLTFVCKSGLQGQTFYWYWDTLQLQKNSGWWEMWAELSWYFRRKDPCVCSLCHAGVWTGIWLECELSPSLGTTLDQLGWILISKILLYACLFGIIWLLISYNCRLRPDYLCYLLPDVFVLSCGPSLVTLYLHF